MQPLAAGTHDLQAELPAQEVPIVADRQRVETIVTNLLDNAIKYSPDGGPITCRLDVDGAARLSVSDRGLGIAPEDMPTLFTRFGRIVRNETTTIAGTGLGLYLSRELARLQEGELTAESEQGKGSTFTLRLPLAPRV